MLHWLARENCVKFTALAGYAACAWSLLFAAPHLWWALGVSAAFPGGDAAYEAALRISWFLPYDLVIVILLAVSALVALALVQKWHGLFFSRQTRVPNLYLTSRV
jgi:hypothetical protein